MANKILLTFTIIFLLFAISAWLLPGEENILFTSSHIIARWIALLLMLINGTLIKRKYMTIVYFMTGLYIIGILFKIMHLTGADELLLISMTLIPLIYTVHFLTKKQKGFLDFLKELTVITHFIISMIVILHIIPAEYRWEATIVSTVIFWITFLFFVAEGVRRKTLFG